MAREGPRRFVSHAGRLLALAGLYLAAGKLGLLLAFVHPSATAVWPPTGLALAALLVLGYRAWPGIFIGAFLVNLTTEGSVATSIGIATGNTLEGVLGAYLCRRFADGRAAFDRPPSVFAFTLLAAMVSTTLSATIGITSLSLGGFAAWADYPSIWLTWWLGDAAGALIVAPFVILWSENPRPGWTRRAALEAALLGASVLIVGQNVFGGWLPTTANNYPLCFISVPLLLWAAFRFGQRETATALVLLSAIAIRGTLRGMGPFVRETPNESLLLLQAFMGVTGVMALAVAALVAERRRTEQDRHRLIAQLRAALDNIKVLRGLLPICAYCKRIRNDETDCWEALEIYIEHRSDAEFTHGVCPNCLDQHFPGLFTL